MSFNPVQKLKGDWIIRRTSRPKDYEIWTSPRDYEFVRIESLQTGQKAIAHIQLYSYDEFGPPENFDYEPYEYIDYYDDVDPPSEDEPVLPNHVRKAVKDMADKLSKLHF